MIWKYFDLICWCFWKGCMGEMIWKYFDLQFLDAFEKDVWYKWYENTLVCNFLPFQKDVWDKSNENACICDFLHSYKGCMG